MNILPKAVTKVSESFQKLPGIGPKTAQRLAFYLLHVPQPELDRFGESLINLRKNTLLCSICKNVAESDPCTVCADPNRDQSIICVVETPLDVLSLERTGKFHGVYHVLHGALDPLNNIGPDEIYISELIKRVQGSPLRSADAKALADKQGFAGQAGSRVQEIILATNPNMEGESTALYIAKQVNSQESKVKVTRLAHGLPVGADIEYADEVTLSRALEGRREY